MAGGVLSPLLAILLLWVLPQGVDLLAPAIGFACVMIVIHLVLVQGMGARLVGVRYRDLVGPLLRPAIATAISSGVLVAGLQLVGAWNVVTLGVVVSVFGAGYAGWAWLRVLAAADRARAVRAALRLIGRAPARATTPASASALTGRADLED
jgi:hypothetical protein